MQTAARTRACVRMRKISSAHWQRQTAVSLVFVSDHFARLLPCDRDRHYRLDHLGASGDGYWREQIREVECPQQAGAEFGGNGSRSSGKNVKPHES